MTDLIPIFFLFGWMIDARLGLVDRRWSSCWPLVVWRMVIGPHRAVLQTNTMTLSVCSSALTVAAVATWSPLVIMILKMRNMKNSPLLLSDGIFYCEVSCSLMGFWLSPMVISLASTTTQIMGKELNPTNHGWCWCSRPVCGRFGSSSILEGSPCPYHSWVLSSIENIEMCHGNWKLSVGGTGRTTTWKSHVRVKSPAR